MSESVFSFGYCGTCSWEDSCERPANAMRLTEDGVEWLPVCDNHSIPGEVATATLQALQDLYDDWNGPDTEATQQARTILQAARESIGQP